MSEKKIIKFELEDLTDKTGYASFTRVDIPKGGKVIDVSYAGDKTYLHVICNPNHKKKERWFATFEESMPMEDYEKKTFEYIGRAGASPELYVFEVHD
jgi:acetoacetate decarboxylase